MNSVESAEKVANLTPSVLVLARSAGITAKAMAGALLDSEANDDYVAEVSAAYLLAARAKAKATAKAAK